MSLSQSGIVPAWIDKGADPCQDFFAYACGGFTKTAQIPPDRSSWGAIQLVTKDNEDFLRTVLEDAAKQPNDKLGTYYAACMDEDGIEKARRRADPAAARRGREGQGCGDRGARR